MANTSSLKSLRELESLAGISAATLTIVVGFAGRKKTTIKYRDGVKCSAITDTPLREAESEDLFRYGKGNIEINKIDLGGIDDDMANFEYDKATTFKPFD